MYQKAVYLFLLLLFSCHPGNQRRPGRPVGERSEPVIVPLNMDEGYRINQVTGDSIHPLINSSGDTVVTGRPVPAEGIPAGPAGLSSPVAVPAGKPEPIPARSDTVAISGKLDRIPFNPADWPTGRIASPAGIQPFLVNPAGDTVLTGVPVPVHPRQVAYRQKRPSHAFPPGMKDNTTSDLTFLDVYHGMFSAQVVSILEDSRNQIWFGTSGGGASLYDGNNFKHMTGEEGLCESWIVSMIEDRAGRIWFGSFGQGVMWFSGEYFYHLSVSEGLGDYVVECILEDRDGMIWFGTHGGLVSFDGESLTHYTRNEGLPDSVVLSLGQDPEGNLWIGTRSGISLYDGRQFRNHVTGYGISAILPDSQGKIWFGTRGAGLIAYDGSEAVMITEATGLESNLVTSLVEDSRGNIWIGNAGGGATVFNGHGFKYLNRENGLNADLIEPIIEDKHGNIWIGSIGAGVYIYNDRSFKHLSENEGLSSRAIYSMLEDSRGNYWFGTIFGGVTKFDGTNYYRYDYSNGLGGVTVESILEDSRGNLWFGLGGGGATRFDGNRFTHFNEKEGLSGRAIGSILQDRNGDIWFSTMGDGIIQYDGTRFIHFTEGEGLGSNMVECMLEDSRGNLWIGTLGAGVSRFDGKQFTTMTTREGLCSNFIGSMAEDSRGNLWFGSMNEGLSIFDGEIFISLSRSTGLSDNGLSSITEDKDGNIWLSTDKGLSMIRFGEGSDSMKIYTFGLQDGLKGMNFLQNSVLLDSENRIWWGTNKAVTMLDLDEFSLPASTPEIHLDHVVINGRFRDFRNLREREQGRFAFDSVARYHNYPLNLQLPYSMNHLSFLFTAIDWSAPHKITYSYRIAGVDDQWSVPGGENRADYRNLPSGTHTFEVRAAGEAQLWSEPARFTFTISPPWYLAWWAWTGYVLLAFLLVFGLVRWRTAALEKRQRQLEHTVKLRTREVYEKNEALKQQNEELATQRDEIEAQRDLVTRQKDQIVEQKQSMTESIHYARRIQSAILPPDEVLKYLLPRHFLIYRPQEIVSGDFYWLTNKLGKIVIAVADCTGHGVPGAFMSMLGSALLRDVVNDSKELSADLILNELRDRVIESLRQSGEADETKEGMDMGLFILESETLALQYAGANNPLLLIRNGEITEIKGDPMPVGISPSAGKSFTRHDLNLRKGDALYMFSDGYLDQTGGPKGKRFMISRFKETLLGIQDKIMHDQREALEQALDEWMGLAGKYDQRYEQIDDIIVMGIKI